MEVTREMIYQEALALQDAVARLRVEVMELEVIMERIEAMGPLPAHELMERTG
jgi:hypothetical protein